jgi:hypothetical protein
MLQVPSLVFSLVLVTVYTTLFLLALGRGLRALPLFWLAALAGFVGGQLAGTRLHLVPWAIGEIHIVEASAAAFFFLILANWLKKERTTA